MTWAERAERDPELRAFLDAEMTRAGIDLHTMRLEMERWKRAAQANQRKLEDYKAQAKKKG